MPFAASFARYVSPSPSLYTLRRHIAGAPLKVWIVSAPMLTALSMALKTPPDDPTCAPIFILAPLFCLQPLGRLAQIGAEVRVRDRDQLLRSLTVVLPPEPRDAILRDDSIGKVARDRDNRACIMRRHHTRYRALERGRREQSYRAAAARK